MGLGGVGEAVGLVDAELESALGDAVEDFGGAGFEVRAGGDVVLEGGAGDVERAHGREADEVEGRDGAGGCAEEDEGAAGLERGEGGFKGGLADGVVDDGDALAAGEVFDLGGEVGLGVEDGFVGAGFAGELGFFGGGDGGKDAGSEGFGHLGEEEAGAARAGVDENRVVGLDGVGGVGEVVGGHALEEGGGGLFGGEGVGDGDEAIDGGGGELGVGAGDAAPGDAVSGTQVGAEVGGGGLGRRPCRRLPGRGCRGAGRGSGLRGGRCR